MNFKIWSDLTSSFPKKLNFLDQTNTNDSTNALTFTTNNDDNNKNSFINQQNSQLSLTTSNNNSNNINDKIPVAAHDSTLSPRHVEKEKNTKKNSDENKRDAGKKFNLKNNDHNDDEEEEEEVLKDLECEDDDDDEQEVEKLGENHAEVDNDYEDDKNNFMIHDTDYFKIIDRKLELEKLKKKNKHQYNNYTNSNEINRNNDMGPYSCVNKYDNFRAKSVIKAAAWEISPTKPFIESVKPTSSSLHFNKCNFDRFKFGGSEAKDEGNENDFEFQEKLFTYHRYKLVWILF